MLILFCVGEHNIRECDVLSSALYPKVFRDYMRFKDEFGPMEPLPTRLYLTGPEIGEQFQVEIEEGKVLNITILAIGELQSDGQREVFCEMNGQLRAVFITDKTGVEVLFILITYPATLTVKKSMKLNFFTMKTSYISS